MFQVVIVDDDELSLRLFHSIASEIPDVTVTTFRSSTDALAWCVEKDVDCFLLDYHLPAPNGVEMIRRLRAMDAFALVPIVIVTGEVEREVRYRAFDAGATDFIRKPVDRRELVARLTTMLSLRAAQKQLGLQIGSLESSLLLAEERAREHAERLEALWRIANNPSLADDELVAAMLEQSAAAMRAGQPFVGLLGRIDGEEIVTEAIAGVGDDERERILRVGMRVPLEQKIVARALGWQAEINTRFTAGDVEYTLTFASVQPVRRPFGPLDRAYVEILAQFFVTHLKQRWQLSRIRQQLEHDELTGLWNRSRFRSLGRAALRPGEPAAVLVLDVVDFHRINENEGHRAGDEVLVELAVGLEALTTADEIVARVGGDSFAVLFPRIPDSAWVRKRVAGLRAVFARVASAAGLAIAPEDGATLDELLLRAEARTQTVEN